MWIGWWYISSNVVVVIVVLVIAAGVVWSLSKKRGIPIREVLKSKPSSLRKEKKPLPPDEVLAPGDCYILVKTKDMFCIIEKESGETVFKDLDETIAREAFVKLEQAVKQEATA